VAELDGFRVDPGEKRAQWEEATRVALSAAGLPGVALAVLQEPSLVERREALLRLLDEALDSRARAATDPATMVVGLRLADELRAMAQAARGGDEKGGGRNSEGTRPVKAYLADLLEIGQAYLRDILVIGAGARGETVHHQDRLERLTRHAGQLEPQAAARLIQLLRETGQILDRNVAPQLALERMFLNFLHPGGTT
jgi:hypothetical protein